LQHECAHSFAAAKLGFRLNKIVLMPYGAVIRGDLSGISLKVEIAVDRRRSALTILFTAIGLFVSLWVVSFPDYLVRKYGRSVVFYSVLLL